MRSSDFVGVWQARILVKRLGQCCKAIEGVLATCQKDFTVCR